MDPNGRLFSGLIPRDADFDARARSGTEGSLSVESDAEVAGLFEGGAASSIDRYKREYAFPSPVPSTLFVSTLVQVTWQPFNLLRIAASLRIHTNNQD